MLYWEMNINGLVVPQDSSPTAPSFHKHTVLIMQSSTFSKDKITKLKVSNPQSCCSSMGLSAFPQAHALFPTPTA